MDKKRFDELVESAEEGAVLRKLLRVARAAKALCDMPNKTIDGTDAFEAYVILNEALKDVEHLL
jgi:hypothetical protein